MFLSKKCWDLVQAFEKASGKTVKHKIVARRGGDSSAVFAATETAERELGWKSKLDVNDMCRDQWGWATVSLPPPLPPSSLPSFCLDLSFGLPSLDVQPRYYWLFLFWLSSFGFFPICEGNALRYHRLERLQMHTNKWVVILYSFVQIGTPDFDRQNDISLNVTSIWYSLLTEYFLL